LFLITTIYSKLLERIFRQVPESLEVPHQDCCKEQHDIHAWSSQSSWEMQPEEERPHTAKTEKRKNQNGLPAACSQQEARTINQKPATTRTDGDENRLQKIKGD